MMTSTQLIQPRARRQHGLSLVELMVAITIGVVLLAGVGQIYLGSKQGYRVQEAASRLQENGRFAIELLGRDVREAGSFGCRARAAVAQPGDAGGVTIYNHLNPAGVGYVPYSTGQAVTGVEGVVVAGVANVPPGVPPDSITLQSTVNSGVTVTNTPNAASAALMVSLPNTLAAGNIVLVTNCESGDFFQISSGNPSASGTVVHNTGNASAPGNILPVGITCGNGANAHCLSNVYPVGTPLVTTRQIIYSIAVGASGQPGLFQTVNGVATELVEGVQNMQILYGVDGVDADLSPERYLTAAQVGAANFNQVVSVQISLLLVSTGNAGTNVVVAPQTYNFPLGAAAVTAADTRLRRVFTSTFSLRNRTS